MGEMSMMQGPRARDEATINSIPVTAARTHSGPSSQNSIKKAAESFEAVLLTSLFQKMQESVSALSDDADFSQGGFRDLGVQELASSIAAAGGIGIAKMITPFLVRSR